MQEWRLVGDIVERVTTDVDLDLGDLRGRALSACINGALGDVAAGGIPVPDVTRALARLLDAQARQIAWAADRASAATQGVERARACLDAGQLEMANTTHRASTIGGAVDHVLLHRVASS